MSNIAEVLGDIIIALIPQKDPDESARSYRRRLMSAITDILLGAIVVTNILWTVGWLTYFGLAAPFAQAESVTALKQELADSRKEIAAQLVESKQAEQSQWQQMRYDQIKPQMLPARRDMCQAARSGNQAALDLYTRILEDLEANYRAIAGTDYARSPCSEVLAAKP